MQITHEILNMKPGFKVLQICAIVLHNKTNST